MALLQLLHRVLGGALLGFERLPGLRLLFGGALHFLIEHVRMALDHFVGERLGDIGEIERAGASVDRSSHLLPDLSRQHHGYMKLLNAAMARGRPGPNGQVLTLADYYLLLDEQARNRYAWADLFAAYDFVLAPPLPFVAYPHDDRPMRDRRILINGRDSAFGDALAWAGLATFPDLPSAVVPVGESGGLPCGMQVIGPEWSDSDCIAAAGAIGGLLGG